MIYQLYESLCHCCFRYKDTEHEEIEITLHKIRHNIENIKAYVANLINVQV